MQSRRVRPVWAAAFVDEDLQCHACHCLPSLRVWWKSSAAKSAWHTKSDDESCFFFFFKLTLFAHWILQISPLGREAFPQIALKWTVSVNTSAHIKKITLWHVDSGNLGVWWQRWLVWFPSWMPPPVYDHPALIPMWRRRRWIASCDEEKRRESSTFLVHSGLTKTQNLRGAESEWLPCPWHLINATYQVSKRMDESGHRFIVTGNDVFFYIWGYMCSILAKLCLLCPCRAANRAADACVLQISPRMNWK